MADVTALKRVGIAYAAVTLVVALVATMVVTTQIDRQQRVVTASVVSDAASVTPSKLR